MNLYFVFITVFALLSVNAETDDPLDIDLSLPFLDEVNISITVTPNFDNATGTTTQVMVDKIINQARLHLHIDVQLTDAEIAAIDSTLALAANSGLTLAQFAASLKLDLSTISATIQNLLSLYKNKLAELRNLIEESKVDHDNIDDIMEGSAGDTTVQILLHSKLMNLHRLVSIFEGVKSSLEYTNILTIQNVATAYGNLQIAKLNIADQAPFNSIKTDLRYLMIQHKLIEKCENATRDRLDGIHNEIESSQQTLENAFENRVRQYSDIVHNIAEDAENVTKAVKDNLISCHPAIVDALVSVKVGDDKQVTITIDLSFAPGMNVSKDLFVKFIQGVVALVAQAPADSVIVTQSAKRALSFVVTFSSTAVPDLSVSVSGTVSLDLPPPPTMEQLNQLRNRLQDLQQWLQQAYADKASGMLETKLAEWKRRLENNTHLRDELETEYDDMKTDLDEGDMNYTKILHEVRQNLDVENVLQNRRIKLMNSINQFRAYLAQQRFFYHRTQTVVLNLQIRLLEIVLNGSISVNVTVSLLQDAYLSLLSCNETIKMLLAKKDEISNKLQHNLDQIDDLVKQAKSQVVPKYTEVKQRLSSAANDWMDFLSKESLEALNATNVEVENFTQGLEAYLNKLSFKLHILSDKEEATILRVVKLVVSAMTGAPEASVTTSTSTNAKRSTSTTVNAVVTLDSSTTSTPTLPGVVSPTPSKGDASGISGVFSLFLVLLISLAFFL